MINTDLLTCHQDLVSGGCYYTLYIIHQVWSANREHSFSRAKYTVALSYYAIHTNENTFIFYRNLKLPKKMVTQFFDVAFFIAQPLAARELACAPIEATPPPPTPTQRGEGDRLAVTIPNRPVPLAPLASALKSNHPDIGSRSTGAPKAEDKGPKDSRFPTALSFFAREHHLVGEGGGDPSKPYRARSSTLDHGSMQRFVRGLTRNNS